MKRKINVTIWNEYHHEKHEERIKNVYPDGIHGAIKNKLEAFGIYNVRTATLEESECGLTDEVLDNTDVLIW